jgi:hypothetical protein
MSRTKAVVKYFGEEPFIIFLAWVTLTGSALFSWFVFQPILASYVVNSLITELVHMMATTIVCIAIGGAILINGLVILIGIIIWLSKLLDTYDEKY